MITLRKNIGVSLDPKHADPIEAFLFPPSKPHSPTPGQRSKFTYRLSYQVESTGSSDWSDFALQLLSRTPAFACCVSSDRSGKLPCILYALEVCDEYPFQLVRTPTGRSDFQSDAPHTRSWR